jgi:hypothetical protein
MRALLIFTVERTIYPNIYLIHEYCHSIVEIYEDNKFKIKYYTETFTPSL